MLAQGEWTPYPDVNATLRAFLPPIQAILGERFIGMYLDGSLALGDFDPQASDIDYVVVTTEPASEREFEALRALHAKFNASDSPWATEVEAVYVPRGILRRGATPPPWIPRIERGPGVPLVKERLHSSWSIHWHILREHPVVVAGPDPRPMIDPIAPADLRRAVAEIAEDWLPPSRFDRAELVYRGSQIYLVRTLCRMLYTIDHGVIASKPAAARWAQQALGERWGALIERALTWRKDPADQDPPTPEEMRETLDFMAYTLDRCRQTQR